MKDGSKTLGNTLELRRPGKQPVEIISEDDRIYTWYIDENVKSVSCILIGFQLDHFVLQLAVDGSLYRDFTAKLINDIFVLCFALLLVASKE